MKLQKMVHDIKKNESGIINKFKKLKKKPPPSLPQRDYASGKADSDYENPDDHSDSEMYVVPSEENPDDSYEPPPSEQEKKKIPSAFPISRGEYADNRGSHQQLPPINKPLPSTPSPAMSRPKKPSVPSLPLPSPAAKPKVPLKPKECSDDEVMFIDIPVLTDAGVHSKAWYAATCDRKTAEDALYRSNKDGSFLIRKSSGQDSRQPYTLVVFYNRRVYNIPIRFIESTRQYALGREKSGEERFDSVAEIVENHQRSSLVLIDSQNNTKDSTKLKHIVRVS
uniref:B cell linker n=1 Tax=Athene cunicularia TaxID=194338 RepID=A0A663M9X4_ATHCN